MPRTVLFVQGAGRGVHEDWDATLVSSLDRALGPGFALRYPRMPGEEDPSYRRWSPVLRLELAGMRDGDVLVGHSAGGTVLVHTLAEHGLGFRPAALILIAAPFVGPGGWELEEMPERSEFPLPEGMPVSLWHGAADAEVPVDHARLYARALPQAVLHLVEGGDHQLGEDLSAVAQDILRVTGG
jgi:predicted alpha/beta hydrolase family esterase